MNWLNTSIIFMAVAATLLLSKPVHAESSKFAPMGENCPEILDFTIRRLGEEGTENLCHAYAGQLILVVNTASKCVFTPQYDGLETLYRKYKGQGFVVLGFPSNDFAGQEPGTEAQIQSFCRLTYSVEFPMFEKVHVVRGMAHPFYAQLAQLSGDYPGWNFHKYLIAPDGKLIGSYKSYLKPTDPELIRLIEENLPHG